MSVLLDGFSAPGRGTDGSVNRGDARHHANVELLGEAGLIAMGRGACVEMAQAWATSDSPMARLINVLPRSSSPGASTPSTGRTPRSTPARWRRRTQGEDRAGRRHRRLRWPSFAHSLIRHRLVDEYRLTSTGLPSAAQAR
jgi:hypothetical protein